MGLLAQKNWTNQDVSLSWIRKSEYYASKSLLYQLIDDDTQKREGVKNNIFRPKATLLSYFRCVRWFRAYLDLKKAFLRLLGEAVKYYLADFCPLRGYPQLCPLNGKYICQNELSGIGWTVGHPHPLNRKLQKNFAKKWPKTTEHRDFWLKIEILDQNYDNKVSK